MSRIFPTSSKLIPSGFSATARCEFLAFPSSVIFPAHPLLRADMSILTTCVEECSHEALCTKNCQKTFLDSLFSKICSICSSLDTRRCQNDMQGCTNPLRLVALAKKNLFTVASNICKSSVRKLLHVTFLAPRNFSGAYTFTKYGDPCRYITTNKTMFYYFHFVYQATRYAVNPGNYCSL